MNNANRIILGCLLIILNLFTSLHPCTTAVVSGKFTVDGRPLLFKHRDTSALQNKVMYFSDGKFDYIGVVNSTDVSGKAVWMGLNSAGFAIMNSASYNLNIGDTTSAKSEEGIVMRLALKSCETVDDFEALLDSLPKPLGVEANFGVIDAHGGAAYFETGNYDYRKFDANDPGTAPFGYIIRTNYSFSRDTDQGYGYIRYENADELFRMAAATKSLSAQFILRKVSRCLKHSLTGIDLTNNLPSENDSPVMVNFRDFIPRNSSVSTFVVHGVKPGESPEFCTMWTILGFQLCAVATPVWVKGGENLPSILIADESGNAPLCNWALELKKQCFPIIRGNGKYYLNLAAVMNREGSGILQKLIPLEDRIFDETNQKMAKWRVQGMKETSVRRFYAYLNQMVADFYRNQFGF